MEKENVIEVLRRLGVSNIQVHSKNIQCSCFLARWKAGHDSNASGNKSSMGISISEGDVSVVHCFSCGFSGTLLHAITMYGAYSGEDIKELAKYVVSLEKGDIDAVLDKIDRLEEEKKIQIEVLDESFLDDWPPMAHKYLVNRGISVETQKAWGSRWDTNQKRVVIPVRLYDGALIGAVGRQVVKRGPKYWNYGNFKKAQVLFGEHLARKGDPLVIVEGPLDAVTVWQSLRGTEYSVVGLMGSEASRVQVQRIMDLTDEALLFFDNDPAGITGTRKLSKVLEKRIDVRYVRYGRDEYSADPASLILSGCSIIDRLKQASVVVWR